MINFNDRQDVLRQDLNKMLRTQFSGVMSSLADKLQIATNSLTDFMEVKSKKIYMRAPNYKKVVTSVANGDFHLFQSNMASLTSIFSQIPKDISPDIIFISEYKPVHSARLNLLNLFIKGGNIRNFNEEHNGAYKLDHMSFFSQLSDEDQNFKGLKNLLKEEIKDPFEKHTQISRYANVLKELNDTHKSYIYDIQLPNYLLNDDSIMRASLIYAVSDFHSSIKNKLKKDEFELNDDEINYCKSFSFIPDQDFIVAKMTNLKPAYMPDKSIGTSLKKVK